MGRREEAEFTNMCMVTDAEGRWLMQDRSDTSWPGLVFPGGHVEARESFADSVVREVREETGITVKHPRLVGVKQFILKDGARYVVFFFRAEEFEGELRSSGEGRALWLTPEEVRARRTVDGFYDMLRVFTEEELSELYYGPESECPTPDYR